MAVSDDVAARLETGRAAIAAGDPATAALYLGLVVRLAPTLAGSVHRPDRRPSTTRRS